MSDEIEILKYMRQPHRTACKQTGIETKKITDEELLKLYRNKEGDINDQADRLLE